MGSPIYTVDPYVRALRKILALIQNCRNEGLDIEYINIGGGYCISYTGEKSYGQRLRIENSSDGERDAMQCDYGARTVYHGEFRGLDFSGDLYKGDHTREEVCYL